MRKKSLRTEFFVAVSLTLLSVALLSAVTVFACLRFQKWLVPDENYVMLHVGYNTPDGVMEIKADRFEVDGGANRFTFLNEVENGVPVAEKYDIQDLTISVESIDYGIGRNGPRRKLAYIGAGIAMGVLPAAYSVAGFLLCAMWFYRKKLAPAINVLDDATQHIGRQDLDFTVTCGLENELGELCRSFEQMRQALNENNRELWKMIEERKLIQASVAHDLRNPLAIIKGYTEYLQLNLQTDGLTPQRIQEITGSIDKAAKRLEQYTESVREINQLDDIEIHVQEVPTEELIAGVTSDLSLMVSDTGKTLHTADKVPPSMISIDVSILYRVSENILNNALRYAREKIDISFALQGRELIISVEDDGDGFSEEILKSRNRLLMPAADESGHCGMGLTISRLLCQKHGGRLELANRRPHGAAVKIILKV